MHCKLHNKKRVICRKGVSHLTWNGPEVYCNLLPKNLHYSQNYFIFNRNKHCLYLLIPVKNIIFLHFFSNSTKHYLNVPVHMQRKNRNVFHAFEEAAIKLIYLCNSVNKYKFKAKRFSKLFINCN